MHFPSLFQENYHWIKESAFPIPQIYTCFFSFFFVFFCLKNKYFIFIFSIRVRGATQTTVTRSFFYQREKPSTKRNIHQQIKHKLNFNHLRSYTYFHKEKPFDNISLEQIIYFFLLSYRILCSFALWISTSQVRLKAFLIIFSQLIGLCLLYECKLEAKNRLKNEYGALANGLGMGMRGKRGGLRVVDDGLWHRWGSGWVLGPGP